MDITKIASHLKSMELSPDVLYLDIYNPRLIGKENEIRIAKDVDPTDEKVQERVRKYIEDNFDTADLKDSIEQVGFLKMDRIVVRKHGDDAYVVIEGNRRLAAIKSLLAAEQKRELILKDHIKDTIETIEVLMLDSANDDYEEATWFLQGIRHISGIRDWGPYQQAELVDRLINEHNMSFSDAGKAVGAGRKKTGQMLRAYKGLKQMHEDPTYSDKALPELFSHFEQAWVKNSLREWLGWDEKELKYTNSNALQLFYQWITEDNQESDQPKLKAAEVRDKLSKVIGSEQARKAFVSNEANLDMAFGMALVEGKEYVNWHSAIRGAIDSIRKIPWSYVVQDTDREILKNLIKTASEFLRSKKK
ncbi:MAG: ParB N-terminal domain-containing protein [Thermodesulfobacteriota bacterium]